LFAVLASLAGCGCGGAPSAGGPRSIVTVDAATAFRFTEIAHAAGIRFVHDSGMTAERHFPTANGSGVAIFDYDGDGRMDVYFATCARLPVGTTDHQPNRLYRNLGDGRFEDVTQLAGLGFAGFCHGIIASDFDNDGDQDVFLCNYGPNALYANNGDGTFSDVSHAAGIDRPSWSSGGAVLDFDNDGDLDIYVANYGRWRYPEDVQLCVDPSVAVSPGQPPARAYCAPRTIATVGHFLYRNDGGLTFTEIAAAAGVGRTDGHGFGAVAADLNDDGRIDLYVANDTDPNFLFLNRGDGTFDDATETSGAAVEGHGQAQGSMGVDAEDVDGDGRPELFVTNFDVENNTIYRNLGQGLFVDATPPFGLGDHTNLVGWGCALADLDGDGWPDCFVANGHVDDNRRHRAGGDEYAQVPQLFQNLRGRRFRLASSAGSYFDTPHVARGAAIGDLDDDGDLDLAINHKDDAAAILRNDTPRDGNTWMRLELVGTRSNRDAVGARVEIDTGSLVIHRQRKGGYSVQSAHDPRVLVGLGKARGIARLTVRWPSGAVSMRENLPVEKTLRVVEPRSGAR
jgi:hypothetical protein